MALAYRRPRQRPGFVLTAVWWHPDGSIRYCKYEPIERARSASPEPTSPPRRRHGALAAERQADLFGR